jgi:hypothetical protein
MHRGIRRRLTANVFIGDGRDPHIKISQEPDTLCELKMIFPPLRSALLAVAGGKSFTAIDTSRVASPWSGRCEANAAAAASTLGAKARDDGTGRADLFCHFYLPKTRNNLFGQFLSAFAVCSVRAIEICSTSSLIEFSNALGIGERKFACRKNCFE